MESDKIFGYSENFLKELIEELIELKMINQSSPNNKEFGNKLKILTGKNLNENEFDKLIILESNQLKEKIFFGSLILVLLC